MGEHGRGNRLLPTTQIHPVAWAGLGICPRTYGLCEGVQVYMVLVHKLYRQNVGGVGVYGGRK